MKQFHFNHVYELASIVDDLAGHSSNLIEIPWDEKKVLEALALPSKTSVLHWFIFSSILVYFGRRFRKDNYFMEEPEIRSWEATIERYGISIQPFDEFYSISAHDFDAKTRLGEIFYKWYDSKHDSFAELWEHLTDEVFYLLFGDRNFLLKFNLSLADYLESGEVDIPSLYLNGRGRLKRRTSLPSWLKKAVFFRDRGKCVLCHGDLSGLWNTQIELHYDHIVPLYRWGTNDPSNFQLLCESCNLKKSKKPGVTSNIYQPWWDE